MKVQDVMTAESLKQCSPETKLQHAAKIMKEENCGALPVVDKNNNVVGIVTDRDIALALADKQARSVSDMKVSQIMSTDVNTIRGSEDLTKALKKMRTKKVGRLPVVDSNGKLSGILSVHNLIANSPDGQMSLGNLSSTGESIAKTIKALSKRYSPNSQSKSRIVSAGRSESWEEGL